MNVVIFANGVVGDDSRTLKAAQDADLVIAADGGAGHCLRLGIAPALVIGDLDSLSELDKQKVEMQGAEFSIHPADKDETDLELAILAAAERGASEITVVGATGDRLDMTIANLLLLTLPALAEIPVRVLHADQIAWLMTPPGGTLLGQVGDTISLIPVGGAASGINTHGLAFPMDGERLEVGPARGVSNRISEPEPSLEFEHGKLLVVLTPGGSPRRTAGGKAL